MLFRKNNSKINLSRGQFYSIIAVVILFVLANTIFYGIAMDPRELFLNYSSLVEGRTFVSIQYAIGCVIFIALAVNAFLSFTNRITVGYIFTILWNIIITALVFIPIALSPSFVTYQNLINIGIFIIYLIVWFFVYKEIFELRRRQKIYGKFRSTKELEW